MSGAGTWVTFATGSGADFAVHSYPSGGKEPCQRQRASHGSRSPWSWRAVMIARTRSRPTDGPSLRLTSESAPLADVRGTWLWTEEALFSVAAPLTSVFFGIQPEGPITHFTCHESGTMTLTQSGSSFSGTATQDSECRTRGGQVFSPPVFPPILDVAEGTIEGRSAPPSTGRRCGRNGWKKPPSADYLPLGRCPARQHVREV